MNEFDVKGYCFFFYDEGETGVGITRATCEYEPNSWCKKNIYDLMDGMEFLTQVKSGCIMDRDGTLANVFVDGYDTNLGLFLTEEKADFTQGGFLVNEYAWKDICSEFDVKVNWANK